ncbi:response regulator [Myxococcaceae bacterium GXIMD 01537]
MDTAKRSSILLVEDDPDIRESVAEILTMEGYSVAQAVNGQDGLNVLARISVPGLIFLDLMMPVMTGPEFLTRLRADPVFRECTVLLMTASHPQHHPGTAGLMSRCCAAPAALRLSSPPLRAGSMC